MALILCVPQIPLLAPCVCGSASRAVLVLTVEWFPTLPRLWAEPRGEVWSEDKNEQHRTSSFDLYGCLVEDKWIHQLLPAGFIISNACGWVSHTLLCWELLIYSVVFQSSEHASFTCLTRAIKWDFFLPGTSAKCF